jgi:hypothetical protein
MRVIGDRVGTNDANNEIDTSSVVSNADGSLLERLEYIQTAVGVGLGAPGTFNPIYGYHVTKTLATVGATTDPIFDITGKVLVTLITGQVTSVFATTTSLQLATSVGSRVLCASTDVVTEIVNTLYILSGDPDDVLSGTTQNVVGLANLKTGVHAPLILNNNVINQIVDQVGTGFVTWDLFYIPLEASASVSASA